jgi:hypothetical protein
VIWASFLVSFGQEIPWSAALVVSEPLFPGSYHLSIGGVHLGDKVEELEKICRKRGYGLQIGYHRVSWNEDWNLVWGEVNGKIGLITFSK